MKSDRVMGVGVNDSLSKISDWVDGKVVLHKDYKTWYDMFVRCYSPKYHQKKPSYIGCSVHEDWHKFTKFQAWFATNYVEGYHLDKDILSGDSKVYSEDSCIFIPAIINSFITDAASLRSSLPIGVTKCRRKFGARCNNPFTLERDWLGSFDTPEEANLAWRDKKLSHCFVFEEMYPELGARFHQRLQSRYV